MREGPGGSSNGGEVKRPSCSNRYCLNNCTGTIRACFGAWGGCFLSLAHLHQQHLRKHLWLPGESSMDLLCAGRISPWQESHRQSQKWGRTHLTPPPQRLLLAFLSVFLSSNSALNWVCYSIQFKADFWSKSLLPKSIKSPSDDV